MKALVGCKGRAILTGKDQGPEQSCQEEEESRVSHALG